MDAVLLIHPPQSFSNKRQKGAIGYSAPVGLLHLATALKRSGHPVYVVDMDTSCIGLKDIFKIIDEKEISVLGVSTFTRTRNTSYYILEKIRQKYPGIYLLAGGPHCCLLPEEVMANSVADAVVDGEAELEIVEIVNARKSGIIRTQIPMNLDSIPFPIRDVPYIRPRSYGNIINIKHTSYSTFLSSSRGCPYKCTFCSRIHTSKIFRFRSASDVVDEMEMLYENGYKGILFVDDNFTAIRKRANEIVNQIKERNIKMDCLIQSRCIPSESFWANLVSAGFNVVSLGVEHVKPDIIRYFNKHPRPEEWPDIVEASIRIMNRLGIITCVSLILGAPMETKKDAEEAIEFCRKTGADIITTNELEFVCGSQLWRNATEAGLFPEDRLCVAATEIMPEKRGYISELDRRAWKISAVNLPRLARKILKIKRDRRTPLASMGRWVVSQPMNFLSEGYKEYGYGRAREE